MMILCDLIRTGRILSLHSFEECRDNKTLFTENFVTFEKESNKMDSARLAEPAGDHIVVINPPFSAMTEADTDRLLTFHICTDHTPNTISGVSFRHMR